MITLEHVQHHYGKFHALKDVNISLQRGSLVGFIGPNGAGKSTTLKILCGLIVPTSGKVLLDGHSYVEDPFYVRAKIGYMPETPILYRELRVTEYLEYIAKFKGMKSGIKEKVSELIELFSLQRFARTLIGNLSKGNRQRVALAQALLGDPEVLLLDEPTSALDPKSVIEIRNVIKSFRGKMTVLMSSHILSEISEVCDHILMIRDGEIKFQGTIHQIEDVANPEAKELIVRVDRSFAQFELLRQDLPGSEFREQQENDLLYKVHQDNIFYPALFQILNENHIPVREILVKGNKLEKFFE